MYMANKNHEIGMLICMIEGRIDKRRINETQCRSRFNLTKETKKRGIFFHLWDLVGFFSKSLEDLVFLRDI